MDRDGVRERGRREREDGMKVRGGMSWWWGVSKRERAKGELKMTKGRKEVKEGRKGNGGTDKGKVRKGEIELGRGGGGEKKGERQEGEE